MTQFRNINLRGPSKVRIIWTCETPCDDLADRPDERDEGFWPSLDPESAGYIGDHGTDAAMRRFHDELNEAQERMTAWENGYWEYVGVIAKADVYIPIGGNSYVIHTFRSAGVWGVESDARDYHATLYKEEKAALLDQLQTLGAALASGDYIDQTDGKSAVPA